MAEPAVSVVPAVPAAPEVRQPKQQLSALQGNQHTRQFIQIFCHLSRHGLSVHQPIDGREQFVFLERFTQEAVHAQLGCMLLVFFAGA